MYRSRALWLILALGLALRLLYGLAQDPLKPYGITGGDDPWYLAMSLALVTDAPPGMVVNGFAADIAKMGQPPVFFLAAGIPQTLLPPGPAVQVLRVVQALATTAVAFFACGLAVRLVEGLPGDHARRAQLAGLIAALALALSPALIIEAAEVKTESLFIFFVTGGVWAYVEAVANRRRPHPPTPSPLGEGGTSSAHSTPSSFPSPMERGPRGEVRLVVEVLPLPFAAVEAFEQRQREELKRRQHAASQRQHIGRQAETGAWYGDRCHAGGVQRPQAIGRVLDTDAA